MKRVFIIAEAGVNHNGDVSNALQMIDVAKKCGADAIKFQTFNPCDLVTAAAPKARYQRMRTAGNESQREMLANLALGADSHKALMRRCRERDVKFISSPFDLESIKLLQSFRIDIFKIPSGEITNVPYLELIGSMNKKLIMSTGMATMNEIETALSILRHAGTRRGDISLLHCTTEYPAPFSEVNLRAMASMRERFNVAVGYSDHTAGCEVAVAAVALGAGIIEKHFTLCKTMQGPDHAASLAPDELEKFVRSIRNVESAMGSKIKKPSQSERATMRMVRKSIVALKEINRNDVFSVENITTKRPGTGIPASDWHKILGKRAKHHFGKDQLIRA